MKFKVTATTKEGEKYDEVVEAADRFAVYRELRARGDRVTSIHEEGRREFSLAFITDMLHGISTDDQVFFTRNLAAMVDAGLTISRALAVMERQSRNPRLKTVIESLIAAVRKGDTFSSALAMFPKVFSRLLVSMVKAGEESGKLGESLRVVALQMERASALKKKIRGALIYPAIVICAMIVIAILMLIYVVPTLTATFVELHVELPASTKFLIAASNLLQTQTIVVFAAFAAIVGAVLWGLKTARGAWIVDYVTLHIPLFKGLVMETNAARTTRTLSSLLSSGVDMVLALGIVKDVVQNSFYQKVLSEAEADVVKGGALAKPFEAHTELYPPLVAEMIAVGEETGRLSDLLKETAEFYEQSVEQQTKDLSTIIEPLLMLFIGAGVGFFAVSMIGPIYSLSNSIGG